MHPIKCMSGHTNNWIKCKIIILKISPESAHAADFNEMKKREHLIISQNTKQLAIILLKRANTILKKQWCCISGMTKHENLSNELIKVQLPP